MTGGLGTDEQHTHYIHLKMSKVLMLDSICIVERRVKLHVQPFAILQPRTFKDIVMFCR